MKSNHINSIKESKTPKRDYDWAKIELDYVSDSTHTYESLCQKYGPRPKAISAHAIKGKWKGKRLAFEREKQIKLQAKMAEQKAIQEADEIAKINKAHFESQQGIKYLADKKIVEDVNRVKNGKPGGLSVKEIQALASAQKTVQESQRLSMGLTEKELNVNLIYKQLTPLLEKIVEIINEHAPQAREDIIREFETLYG